MTLQFKTNYIPTTGSDAIFQFKTFLVNVMGWTVIQSSDGTTVYSGDGIYTAGPGTNGLANDRAWFTIQVAGSTRQFSFQHVDNIIDVFTNKTWRIKYSFFGFDVPNPLRPWKATPHSSSGDDQVIYGGGTDTFPTYAPLFKDDGTYVQQIIGDPSTNAVCFFCHTDEKTVPSNGFVFDAMASGSYDTGDIDPFIIYVSGNTINTFSTIDMNNNFAPFCPGGWLLKNLPGQAFVKIPALVFANYDSGYSIPFNVGSNPYASEDQFFPIVYARPILSPSAPPYGYKGVSSLMQWCSTQRNKIAVIGINSIGDHVILNNVVMPWNNTALIT
jgi:hypothetical protein